MSNFTNDILHVNFSEFCLCFHTLGTRGFSRVRSREKNHYKDLKETANRARKVSGTQGSVFTILVKWGVFI